MSLAAPQWDSFVAAHPGGHILQTAAWGELKSAFGWAAEVVTVPSAAGGLPESGALVLFRRLPLGLSLAYVPRGPVVDFDDAPALRRLLAALDQACRTRRAVCLKWEPNLADSPGCRERLVDLGFRASPHTVQPQRSLVVDLSAGEAGALARLKQKTRYNLGLARKKDVAVRAAAGPADLERFLSLMAETGQRDNFGVHAPGYYRRAYALFHPLDRCELFLAEHGGEPLAGVMAFALDGRAWYFYGASSSRERNRMAPYLAQWEAMRWALARGAHSYDLWGVPDADEAVLEASFESRHDGLWGVYRFKRGWGGRLVRTVGAWDRVYNPWLYQLYLAYLRRRGVSLG
jgi:lipid II:glycine glycyltransferase (peptidoglycan interpeptide bridge formation enzyme)